jgi:hypothetical protein
LAEDLRAVDLRAADFFAVALRRVVFLAAVFRLAVVLFRVAAAFLAVVFLFAVARFLVAAAFLAAVFLFATDLGRLFRSDTQIADAVGRRLVLVAGVTLFALACLPSCSRQPPSRCSRCCSWPSRGRRRSTKRPRAGHAPELLPEAICGRGFGLIGLVDGVADFVSSVTVGLL